MYTNEINNSLVPLKQWFCDSCGKVIENSGDGILEWYQEILDDNHYSYGKDKGYRIVHNDEKCMYNETKMYKQKKTISDMHLDSFLESDGLVQLLAIIQNQDTENNKELLEIIRRLHVAYYEEARKYHINAEEDGYFEGENEVTRYLTSTSIDILNDLKR